LKKLKTHVGWDDKAELLQQVSRNIHFEHWSAFSAFGLSPLIHHTDVLALRFNRLGLNSSVNGSLSHQFPFFNCPIYLNYLNSKATV
jgi:hypothetical protein